MLDLDCTTGKLFVSQYHDCDSSLHTAPYFHEGVKVRVYSPWSEWTYRLDIHMACIE